MRYATRSCRATPRTDAFSRRICATAHATARAVSALLAAATAGFCSVNERTPHPSWRHRQRRLRHRTRTGSPAHRGVRQNEHLPSRRLRDHSALRAADRTRRRLGIDHEHAIAATLDPGHPEPVESDEQVAAITVDSRTWARGGAARSIRHGSRSPDEQVACSLPILRASTHLTPSRHARAPHPTQNAQSPFGSALPCSVSAISVRLLLGRHAGPDENLGPTLGPGVEVLVGIGGLVQRDFVGDDPRAAPARRARGTAARLPGATADGPRRPRRGPVVSAIRDGTRRARRRARARRGALGRARRRRERTRLVARVAILRWEPGCVVGPG